jgi:putative sigma-54 modulation protein
VLQFSREGVGGMKITVTGKNIMVTEALKAYVEKRVGRLDRYLQGFRKEIEANVILSVEGNFHITEVTIELGAIILRGEERTTDMYTSIDGVVEKIERQIRKYKTRIKLKNRSETREALREINQKLLDVPDNSEEEDEGIKLVRRKRFVLKPMSVEEAVMQMDLLGHDFFVFLDDEDNKVHVVYKRKDGNYGLIEPELA